MENKLYQNRTVRCKVLPIDKEGIEECLCLEMQVWLGMKRNYKSL